MKLPHPSSENSLKIDKAPRSSIPNVTHGAINRTGEEALPILVERMCERRGEPTPHMRCVDGSYMCLSRDLCGHECETDGRKKQ